MGGAKKTTNMNEYKTERICPTCDAPLSSGASPWARYGSPLCGRAMKQAKHRGYPDTKSHPFYRHIVNHDFECPHCSKRFDGSGEAFRKHMAVEHHLHYDTKSGKWNNTGSSVYRGRTAEPRATAPMPERMRTKEAIDQELGGGLPVCRVTVESGRRWLMLR